MTPEYRRDYLRGWRYSQRDTATLEYLDRTGASDATYDGYMDYACGRERFTSAGLTRGCVECGAPSVLAYCPSCD